MARNSTRRRSSRRTPRLDFAAIEITGALLTPDMVARIASFDAADQTEESYSIPPGLKVRDEIARYFRIAEALWHQFEAAREKSPAASERFVLDLLKQSFGFETIKSQSTIRKGEREFPVGHAALGSRAPIVIAPVPDDKVRRTGVDESLTQFGDGSRRRSATLLLQEYLNAEDDALWGICTDGLTLRILRDNVSLTRPAWIEADLAKIFTDGLFPDFSALWLLIHESRFGTGEAAPTDCPLEHWRDTGRIEGTAAREKLRLGVEAALLELGQGFIEHPANSELRAALSQGNLSRQAYFEELLRLVYRLIFLFAAEDRELLHTPGAAQSATRSYAQGYSVARLRERCTRRTSWDKNVDVWEGLKASFRALSEGEPMLGLPALGGLFATGQLAHVREARIENRRMLAAIWRLAWLRPDGQPLTRVNWRDMETEELGSVYESLLELVPEVSATEKSFTFADADQGRGNARKTTASYYTPDSLVQALLDETLDPLIEETVAGKDDQAAIDALLNLRIIDPACGSGHFLLAAARRLASRIARLSSPGTPSQSEYRHWLREVARRTLFGVDKNPMAIELAKVALWIETVEPGKPLSFLDAHLRCGDSLLGIYDLSALQIGIPDDAYKPLTGDDKKAASAWKARNKSERDGREQGELSFFEPPKELLESFRAVESLTEDDLADVRKKAEAYHALSAGEARTRMEAACDLYAAAFLSPKTEPPTRNVGDAGAFIPTSRDVWDKLEGKRPLGLVEHNSVAIARAAGAFHWPLEFPQVFFPGGGRRAGFDLTLGNPPWKVVEERNILEISLNHERLKNWFAHSHFADVKGRKDLYKLFLAMGVRLLASDARLGLILPTGFLMEEDSEHLRRYLWKQGSVPTVLHYQNRRKHFFSAVHASYRFVIFSWLRGASSKHQFSATCTHSSDIETMRRSTKVISGSDLEEHKRSGSYGEIHASVASLELHSKLNATLQSSAKCSLALLAEWHATTDKECFSRSASPKSLGVPKNRNIHMMNANYSKTEDFISFEDALVRLKAKGHAARHDSTRLLIRDIARNDDTRTLLACLSNSLVSTYDVPCVTIKKQNAEPRFPSDDEMLFILAFLNSLLADFLIRPFVDKHIKGYVLSRLPLPKLQTDPAVISEIKKLNAEVAQALGKSSGIEVWKLEAGARALGKLECLIGRSLGVDRQEHLKVIEQFDGLREQQVASFGYDAITAVLKNQARRV